MNFPKFGLCGFLVRALWSNAENSSYKRAGGILRENLASKMVFPYFDGIYATDGFLIVCWGLQRKCFTFF
jgi:hypothetical protein